MSDLYKFNKNSQVDEFGVDHSDFSLHDEIEYNMMRADERENLRKRQERKKEFDNRSPNLDGVWSAAASGFVEGEVGGINRALDSASLGVYGTLADIATDGAYSSQQKKLQSRAEQEGLGYVNKLANKAIDVGAQVVTGKYLGIKNR